MSGQVKVFLKVNRLGCHFGLNPIWQTFLPLSGARMRELFLPQGRNRNLILFPSMEVARTHKTFLWTSMFFFLAWLLPLPLQQQLLLLLLAAGFLFFLLSSQVQPVC